jgi:flagellar biosynthesis regulator FlaF
LEILVKEHVTLIMKSGSFAMTLIEPHNEIVNLCIASTQAEYRGQLDEAHQLVQQAWDQAQDDFEACVAAHYLARYQKTQVERFAWNRTALSHALRSKDPRVSPFLGSLYVNLGQSLETLGNEILAEKYYALAAKYGVLHASDELSS